jgi:exonuclease III
MFPNPVSKSKHYWTRKKKQTNSNIAIVGDFNTLLSPIDSLSRQKIICEETSE